MMLEMGRGWDELVKFIDLARYGGHGLGNSVIVLSLWAALCPSLCGLDMS